MKRSDRKFSRKDHVCSRHFKEEFIIKNSVNGGTPLNRWKLRGDAKPTLFIGKFRFINNSCIIHELILNYAGYKDGVAATKTPFYQVALSTMVKLGARFQGH
jgi:hypothetical protein